MHSGIARDGYLIVENFLSDEELMEAQRETDRILALAVSMQVEWRQKMVSSTQGILSSSQEIYILGEILSCSSWFQNLFFSKKMSKILEDLFSSEAFVYHFANITQISSVNRQRLNWHRDFPNDGYCGKNSDYLRMMICLDGMNDANGATLIDVGSHLITDEQARDEKMQRKRPPPSQIKVATCSPGALIIMHPKVLHTGGVNTSKRPRRNLVFQWGPPNNLISASEPEEFTGRILDKTEPNFRTCYGMQPIPKFSIKGPL